VAVDLATERRTSGFTAWGVVAVLAVANVMSNRVLPDAAYVVWNVAVAVACVALARRSVTFAEMGFTRWRSGAAWGAALFVFTTVALLLAVTMPVFNDLYHDRRVSRGVPAMLYQAVVRIPLGTVVLEEAAFRAVLPALFAKRFGVVRGCLAASALFGLWHVLPALGLNRINPTMTKLFGDGAAGVGAAVIFAVAGTMLGGLWWCWVRYRAGSVLATMIAHVATNSVGYAIAWFVTR
jgi:membrane protease YdiL (CAAX protease family)